jgi:Rieske Fe-S protein
MPGTLKDLFSSKNMFTRRGALKIAVGAFSLSGLYLLYSSLKSQKTIDTKKEKVIIPASAFEGITISGPVIIKKEGNELVVFSSKCTHLGCTINRYEGGMLVCPCHGSKFNINGEAATGPAFKPLQKLEVEKDTQTGELFVLI